MGFLGFANVYAMRVNLSVAIVAMVQDANSTHPNVTTPLPGNLTTTHHHANHTTTTHQHGNSKKTTTTSKTTKPPTTISSPTTENHDSFFGTMFFSRKGENGQFNWNELEQGRILGMFFYGYVLTQLPGGRLAELVG